MFMHSARLCGQQILNNKRKTKKKGDPLEITKKKQKKILCQYRFTLEMKAVFVVSRNGGFFSNFTSKFAVLFCLVRPCEFSIVVFLLIYTTHKQAPATPRTRVKWGNIYRYIPLLRRIIKIGKEKKEWGIYTERFEREAKKTTRLEEAKLLSFLLLLLFCCCFDPTNFEFIVCVCGCSGGVCLSHPHMLCEMHGGSQRVVPICRGMPYRPRAVTFPLCNLNHRGLIPNKRAFSSAKEGFIS